MATYIIAGRPNSELTSQCVLLMDNLQKRYQSIRYVVVIKHPEEWDEYSEEISNLFGFTINTHPLTFLSNGEFIGGRDQFFKKIKLDFKFEYEPDEKTVMDLTIENVKKSNEEYHIKKKGFALRDKIQEKLQNIPDISEKYNTLDEGFEEDHYNGMKVYYIYNPKFNPKDAIKFKNPIVDKNIEIEVIAESTDNPEEDEEDEEEVEDYEEDEEGKPKEKSIKKIKKNYTYCLYQDYGKPTSTIYNKDNYIVDKNFGKDYKILLNPFPHFFGEILLFHDNLNENKINELCIEIPDHGRIPSLRHIKLPEETLQILNMQNVKLNCEFNSNAFSFIENNLFDFDSIPLSENDLHYLMKAVYSIDGIASIKILPYNYHDFKSFCSSVMKIIKLPLKDISYEELPLNIKINQLVKSLKRQKILDLYASTLKNVQEEDLRFNLEHILNHEEFTNYFDTHDYFKLDMYQFPHLIKYYNFYTFKPNVIANDIKEMMKLLNITNENKKGVCILLTKYYIFIAPLVKPYVVANDVPIFIEPHFFTGIFTLPQIEAEWPYTTESKYIKFDYEEILKISTSE